MPLFQNPGIPDAPAWNTPVPRVIPVGESPLGSLAKTLNEIAAAQRQRQMDELNLKKAQMSLADIERQRADEAAFRSEMARIGGMTDTVEGYGPTAPKGVNPFSPVPMTPDMQVGPQQVPLPDERIDELLGQAALKSGNYDMYQKIQQNLVAKRQDRELKAQGQQIQREKMKQGLLLGFAKNPKGLKLVSPQILSEAGFDLNAVNNMPEDTDEGTGIQYFDDPVMGRRPFVRTKQGGIHWLDAYAAGVGLAQARAQATGEQARQTGQALGTGNVVAQDRTGGYNIISKGDASSRPVTTSSMPSLPMSLPPDANIQGLPTKTTAPGQWDGAGILPPEAQASLAMDQQISEATPLFKDQLQGPAKPQQGTATPKDLENIRLKWQSDPIVQSLEKNSMANARLEGVAQSFERSLAAGQSPAMEQLTILYNFIQNLDNSVVKAGELDLFKQNAATVWQNLSNAVGRYGTDDANVRAMTVDATKKLLGIRREMNAFLNQYADQYAQRFEANFAPRYREQGLVASGAPLVPAPYSTPSPATPTTNDPANPDFWK